MISDTSHAAVNGSATTLKVRSGPRAPCGPGGPPPELLSPAAAAGPGSPLGPRSAAGPLIAPRAPSNWLRRGRFRPADPRTITPSITMGGGLILRILIVVFLGVLFWQAVSRLRDAVIAVLDYGSVPRDGLTSGKSGSRRRQQTGSALRRLEPFGGSTS
jgi:hypothetical protein